MDTPCPPLNDTAPEATDRVHLLVCLGNPGSRYEGTRHNIGFRVGDAVLASAVSAGLSAWQPGNGALYDGILPGGVRFRLLKPWTYMNASGEAAGRVTEHFGISPSDVLVIGDCADLPFGRLRMRPGGSCGGHNGLRSVLAALGTTAVPRFRVGIGRPQSGECDTIEYVLSRWTSGEETVLGTVVPAAARIACLAVCEGLQAAMREGNGFSPDRHNAEEQVQGV